MGIGFARWVGIVSVFFTVASMPVDARADVTCAIDMGSNSFRRIVARFENGRYAQHRIEVRTLGVGDDVARNGRISDAKLEEIRGTLAAFKGACNADRAARVTAIGTAAFRDAPNGARAVEIAAQLGIAMSATEQRESELAYLAGSLGRDGYAVIDNGSRASSSCRDPRVCCATRYSISDIASLTRLLRKGRSCRGGRGVPQPVIPAG